CATRADLLQAILYDLSLPYEGCREQELRLRLTEYLLTNYRAGKRAVLLVDEAQLLPPDVLEELRLLGNLEAGQGKAVQVILVAQPGILETLKRTELASLQQRLAVRASLTPLETAEAIDYLKHHLRAAGGQPEAIVTDESLTILASAAQGIPRILNQV